MRKVIWVCLLFAAVLPLHSAATLSVTTLNINGINVSLVNVADDTLYIPNNGKMFIRVTNTSGSPCTLLVISRVADWQSVPEGTQAANLSVVIPATTGDKIIGPFNPRSWNDANGYILCKFSTITNVMIQAFTLP